VTIPLLFTLPSTARLAYPFILSGVRRGMSSRAIESSIRSAGLPISRGRSILPIQRALKEIDRHGRNLRFINKSLRVDTSRLPESITDIRKRFSYQYIVKGIDPNGQFIERQITISTDNADITVGELDQIAEEIATSGNNYAVLDGVTVTLDFGIKKAGAI